MSQRFKIVGGFSLLIGFVLSNLLMTTLLAQNRQEIVLTIEGIASSDKVMHFNRAEELRKKMKFREAIEEYQKVISGGQACGKESEAQYDMGICYLWLGKLDSAEAIFQSVMQIYPDDHVVIAYTKFSLSWIDVQRGNFQAAINCIQQTLDQKHCSEIEYCSVAQFEIGRIYLVYMHDHESAETAFRKVLEYYPNSRITEHPFLQKLKSEKVGD